MDSSSSKRKGPILAEFTGLLQIKNYLCWYDLKNIHSSSRIGPGPAYKPDTEILKKKGPSYSFGTKLLGDSFSL